MSKPFESSPVRKDTVLLALAIAGAVAAAVLIPWPAPQRADPTTKPTTLQPTARPDHLPDAPPLPAIEPDKQPGLKLTFQSGAIVDVRPARMIALRVPEGTAPTPFVPAGAFTATWEGEIEIAFPMEYVFSADGRGTFELFVNGKSVLSAAGEDLSKAAGEPVLLPSDNHRIKATYTAPASGDAWVRLYWKSDDSKAREPIPWLPSEGRRFHDVADPALRAGERLRQGRELFAELRCLKCHAQPVAGEQAMPELAIDAPDLSRAGARLRPEWMAAWLRDPKALRGDATMPKVLHGPTAEADAHDIAAYLGSLGKPEPAVETAGDDEVIAQGGRLVGNLGCVVCHTLPDREDWADVKDRIALRNVKSKWQPTALRAFLKKPDAHYTWIRMPEFRFTDEELKRILAYLGTAPEREFPKPATAPSIERGRKLVETSGCLSCHKVGELKNAAQAPALADIKREGWQRGCLAEKAEARRKAPDHALTPDRRAALLAFAATDRQSLTRDIPTEFAARQIRKLNCLGCHKRDGQEDRWSELTEETAALTAGVDPEEEPGHFPAEQVRPTLTWIGEKLRPEWTQKFLSGKLDYKPRPFLRARMPSFPVRTQWLVEGLSLEHGYPLRSEEPPAPEPALAEIGRNLSKKNGGLSCTNCHSVGDWQAVGVFEAPGVNFARVKDRIFRPYYDRWMIKPSRVEPGTKMPEFNKEGFTDVRSVLGGDSKKQFEAMWQFLMTGEKIRPPDP